ASSVPAWFRVEPPQGVATREAQRLDQRYRLLPGQHSLRAIAGEAAAIPLDDVLERGSAAFIRVRHHMDVARRDAYARREGVNRPLRIRGRRAGQASLAKIAARGV